MKLGRKVMGDGEGESWRGGEKGAVDWTKTCYMHTCMHRILKND